MQVDPMINLFQTDDLQKTQVYNMNMEVLTQKKPGKAT